jgi:hypothetical protein
MGGMLLMKEKEHHLTMAGQGEFEDEDLVKIKKQMLSSEAPDDHYKQNMPIDLGSRPGAYGVTVDENRGYNMEAAIDPGGISPGYELRQMKDDISKGKKKNLKQSE